MWTQSGVPSYPGTVYSVIKHLNKLSERSISLCSTGMGNYTWKPAGGSPKSCTAHIFLGIIHWHNNL